MTTETKPPPTLRKSRTVAKSATVDPEVAARAEARLALAYDQRIDLRLEVQDILTSLGRGLTAYNNANMPWPWPDSSAIADPDPHNWRRVGKLAWLLARLETIRRQLEWQASTRPLEPFYCPACDPDAGGKVGYLSAECAEHDTSPASAVSWADALWGSK